MTGDAAIAAIALGSNLSSEVGDLEANLREAIRRAGLIGRIVAVSTFYETEPVGTAEQPKFLNGALLLESQMTPMELMKALLRIESAMGRVREPGVLKGPRIIDLDLLLFGSHVVSTADLTLPHPAMHTRSFVLQALQEIAPGMVHPVLGRTITELLDKIAPCLGST